jgi:hypothetical protein
MKRDAQGAAVRQRIAPIEVIIKNKSRVVINFFTGKLKQRLLEG